MSTQTATVDQAADNHPVRDSRYVLVTAAKNEAAFIEQTIKSVVSQTVKPLRWVIVSDGSTDETDVIVSRYAVECNWIELIRMPTRTERHFAGKVHAFNAGLASVVGLPYRFVGALDADITFDPEYFAFLLGKLHENTRLGLVGTPFEEEGVTYDYRFASVEHVSGACQFFRRECFEAIGGYRAMKSGGIDLVAVLSSRMHGWEVRTFPERTCSHHRKQGSAVRSGLSVIYNDGRKDYLLGADPLWQVFRAVFRFRKRPFLIGGLALLTGYMWPMLLRRPRTAPADVIAFRREDQRQRLRVIVRGLLGAPVSTARSAGATRTP
jgi:biofilm PGA synthesis N-glycosyltransferase PgaC